MATKTIEISKKNYLQYKKVKQIMDELVILDKIHVKTTYDEFAKNVNAIFKKGEDIKLTFKEFIADTKDDETVIDIDYQEYEALISATTAYRAIKIFDVKSKGTMNWSEYGIGVDSIIESYKQ
ncbi:MAG: hypothetical protein RLZZ546_2600 [Bacteroidota bacterium]|jgi:mRNA-degrading endonuclease HigB of HigAB toxin-antitoxin module